MDTKFLYITEIISITNPIGKIEQNENQLCITYNDIKIIYTFDTTSFKVSVLDILSFHIIRLVIIVIK